MSDDQPKRGPTALDGTVAARPDERYCYVVEVPSSDNVHGDPQGKWLYRHSPFDSMDEAVAVAKAHVGPVRVRSFKVQHMPQDYAIHPSVFTTAPLGGVYVPLIDYVCVDHPEHRIGVPASAKAPRCPTCHAGMVSPAFAESLRKAK